MVGGGGHAWIPSVGDGCVGRRGGGERTRGGCGIRGARALGRDEVAVPVGAVLGDASLGRVVDVDDAEPHRVAPRPLEVVEERPREVAAHVGAGGHRVGHAAGVAGEVVHPLGVVHLAVVGRVVGERRAVLGHVQRQRRELARDAQQHVAERVGRVRPVERRRRRLDLRHARAVRRLGVGRDERVRVVVDAGEVRRRRDEGEVAAAHEAVVGLLDGDAVHAEHRGHVLAVRAVVDGLEEDAVEADVDDARRCDIRRAAARRVQVADEVRDAELRAAAAARGTRRARGRARAAGGARRAWPRCRRCGPAPACPTSS